MKISDVATACLPSAKHEIIGIRPGEKLHEQMIGFEDAPYTYRYKDHYKILPMIHNWHNDPMRIKDGIKVLNDFIYSSDNNLEWMSIEALNQWINQNKPKIGVN